MPEKGQDLNQTLGHSAERMAGVYHLFCLMLDICDDNDEIHRHTL